MRHFASVLLLLMLSACAGIDVVAVDPSKDNVNGIRYYRAAPYLLVHTDNAGGLTSELVYLPDLSSLMSAHPYNFVATNSVTMTFDKGVMKTSETEADSAAVPKAVVSALEKVAIAAIGAANETAKAKQQPTVPLPKLYRIVTKAGKTTLFDENGEVKVTDPNIDAIHGNKEGLQ